MVDIRFVKYDCDKKCYSGCSNVKAWATVKKPAAYYEEVVEEKGTSFPRGCVENS